MARSRVNKHNTRMAEEQAVPPNPSETSNGNDSDQDFEPTAEMMVDDFDDERTMAEEEELEGGDEEEDDELELLKNEQDMPIDKLKEMFGYRGDHAPAPIPLVSRRSSSDEETDDEPSSNSKGDDTKDLEDDGDVKDGKEKDLKDKKETTHKLLTRSSRTAQLLRGGSQDSTDDEDEDEFNDRDDRRWKKTIQVGSSFQADIPESFAKYDDVSPYENEDILQWEPDHLDDQTVVDYYEKWQATVNKELNGDAEPLPMGNHVRDDERALWLLQQCGFSVEEALRRQKLGGPPGGAGSFVNGDCDMTPWSEEECRNFEAGLRLHGKDFFTIKSSKLTSRSVKELVNFYYLWKKTERHDVFTSRTRLEKKKYALHPGTTDYMDKFLDEQEALISRSSSPGEGSKGTTPSGKTESPGGSTNASGTASGASGNTTTTPSNNNTIQASSASIPSPQPIPTQPVT